MTETKEQLLRLLATRIRKNTIVKIGGIYFLFDKGEVVYIGKSTDVFGRVHRHAIDGHKSFDAWAYLELGLDTIDKMERQYVQLLRPKYNVTFNPSRERQRGPQKIGFFEYDGWIIQDIKVTDKHRQQATDDMDRILRGHLPPCTENAHIR